jgi:hypothetical protein
LLMRRGHWLDAPFGAPLPSPFFRGWRSFRQWRRGWQSSDAFAPRERISASSLPDSIRPSTQRSGSLGITAPFASPRFGMDHRVKPGGDGGKEADRPAPQRRPASYFAAADEGENRMTKTTKFAPKEWQARFNAGAKQAQREYCTIFAFWRACRHKPCRRSQQCLGHARTCLKRGLDAVPYADQHAANLRIIAATPPRTDAPTGSGRRSDAQSLVTYGPD